MTGPQPRRYASTANPIARRIVTEACRSVLAHRSALDDALAARRDVLREQYRDGVEPRDLLDMVHAAGQEMSEVHLGRLLRGARPAATNTKDLR